MNSNNSNTILVHFLSWLVIFKIAYKYRHDFELFVIWKECFNYYKDISIIWNLSVLGSIFSCIFYFKAASYFQTFFILKF